MNRSIFLFLSLSALLGARENPFFSPEETHSLPLTSNVPDTKPRLESVSYTLPDQARILKEVAFTFQNLDGTVDTQIIQVERSVDWHTPLSISQSGRGNTLSPQLPGKTRASANFGFIRFDTAGKELTIQTNDPMIRHLMLSNPARIVVDFKRDDHFQMKEQTLNAPPYLSVSVENHTKYVRAVITLDGRYHYTLATKNNQIRITCK